MMPKKRKPKRKKRGPREVTLIISQDPQEALAKLLKAK
jgi:hypothetical protein